MGQPSNNAAVRKRPGVTEDGEDKSMKKRSRGRPRLETTDETAAERRRTQIRLAQRAYRNRKDTAIDSLKKRVKELEQVNEDMGREFMNLSDFFLGEGMLQASPDAARRLNEATRKFLALSRKATEEASEDEDENAGDNANQTQEPAQEPPQQPQRSMSDSASSSLSSGDAQSTPNTEMSAEDANLSGVQDISDPFRQLDSLADPNVSSVTHSSIRDSSFPVLDNNANVSLFANSYTQSPFNTLPAPTSYASQERSFGRRFQRATVEAGLSLALMENPPPDKYMAVFSFCLQFESRQDIIRRLSLVLEKTRNESLNNWRVPFTNLGGAGTWMSSPDSSGNGFFAQGEVPVGNHGLPQPYKLSQATGFSTGPFSQDIELARDMHIDHRMRMLYPGFEGDFFDADDVDAYLHQRGIIIPEGKDYVEAEIDIDAFERAPDLPPRDFGPKRKDFFRQNTTHETGASSLPLYSSGLEVVHNSWQTTTSPEASIAMNTPFNPAALDSQLGTFGAESSDVSGEHFDESLLSFEAMSEIPWRVWEPPSVPTAKKTKVMIDVNRLIKEMVNTAVCLGRTPGIRPDDVHKAVKLSIALQSV